jgi:BlaI family transcriptional regulator, penicillinase repressor
MLFPPSAPPSTSYIVDIRSQTMYACSMARNASPTLTGAEHRVMDALWKLGSATVADAAAAIGKPLLAYTTVLTVLRTLERKGYVRHRVDGRAYVYAPSVDRDAVRRDVVGYVLQQFFDGSPRALLLNLLESESVDDAELRRLRTLIDKSRDGERNR